MIGPDLRAGLGSQWTIRPQWGSDFAVPKIVDHEQRRQEIVDAYLRLLARDGVAATTRAIAGELGVATGAIWHYFDGFDSVVAAAFTRVLDLTDDRIGAATRGLSGLEALYAMMGEILPLSKVTVDEAYVVVGFWGRLASNASLASAQAGLSERWEKQLAGFLDEARADGTLLPDAPVAELADLLLSIGAGQQAQVVMGTPLTAPDRQVRLLDTILRPWQTGHVGSRRAASTVDTNAST